MKILLYALFFNYHPQEEPDSELIFHKGINEALHDYFDTRDTHNHHFSKAVSLIYKQAEKVDRYFTYVVEEKDLFKYTANLTVYRQVMEEGKISFVSRDTLDDPFDSENLLKDDEIKSKTRILSLTNSKENHAMWGTYANAFKGVCLEYNYHDFEKALTAFNKKAVCFFGLVEYANKSKPNLQRVIPKKVTVKNRQKLEEIQNIFNECFFKEKSWSYQDERRFIFLNEKFEKDFEDIICSPRKIYKFNLINRKVEEL